MHHTQWYLLVALAILLVAFPLLLRMVRALSAPWRLVAQRYPGPGPEAAQQISLVTARFWGKRLPFSLARAIRIRTTDQLLCFSVLGPDFLPARLSEIVIPRSAITTCEKKDLLVARQRLTLAETPVRIIIYGKGAKFVRAWWHSGSGGTA